MHLVDQTHLFTCVSVRGGLLCIKALIKLGKMFHHDRIDGALGSIIRQAVTESSLEARGLNHDSQEAQRLSELDDGLMFYNSVFLNQGSKHLFATPALYFIFYFRLTVGLYLVTHFMYLICLYNCFQCLYMEFSL